MSLRLVPSVPDKTASVNDTANSFGLHDTLQYGPRSLAAEVRSKNSLKHRLDNWEESQYNLKLTMQRNMFGIHAPVRLLMERKIVSASPHLPSLSRSNIHLDILMGRDETIDCADVLDGPVTAAPLDLHREMERKLRM